MPPPQASKASPARGGAAAGGGGVPHLALPIPSRLAAHAPPPPNLTANCRLPVGTRSRPQCRAGVHARRSSLASPHPAADLQSLPCKGRCRRRRRRGAAPRPANTLPARRTRSPATYLRRRIRQPAAAPSSRRKPPKPPLQGEVPPQAAEGCRTSPCQYPSGPPHTLPCHIPAQEHPPASGRPPPPPQASKASPVRGGAAAGGGGVPHLAPPIPFRVAALPRHRTPCTDPRRFATCLPLPRRKTKTAARLFAGPRSPRVFFHCLRRRARMGRRVLPRYASPPSSRRINGTTSLGWMSSTSANSVYSIFSASRMAASSKPESRLPTACRFFLKS